MVKVTITPEKEREVFQRFDSCLTDEEEAKIRGSFEHYLFYETYGRKNFRECYCPSCRAGFEVTKDEDKAFFGLHHNDLSDCPRCGQSVQLKCVAKCQSFKSLHGSVAAAVIRTDEEGNLYISHGIAFRDFQWNELDGFITWEEKCRYYLEPGAIGCWTRTVYSTMNPWYWCHGQTGEWKRNKTCVQPFQRNYKYGYDESYVVIGIENVDRSKLRYCGIYDWAEDQLYASFSSDMDESVKLVTEYLAEACAKPQIEMLAKLGLFTTITQLLMGKSATDINWRGKTPWSLLRMTRQDWGTFKKNPSIDLLQIYHAGIKMQAAVKMAGRIDAKTAGKVMQCAKTVGVKLQKAVFYLDKTGEKLNDAAQLWEDYLRMGKQLDYDMSRPDVAMPKNLRQRHDTAAATIKVNEDEIKTKAYRKRYEQLRKKYEFTYAGITVVVPVNAQQIILEGKTLQICVGGYASWHIEGQTTILFLRKERTPGRSLFSIEMKGLNGDEIRQVHGYRNEGEMQRAPKEQYPAFFAAWTQWLREGSKRDRNGRPIIKTEATA